MSGDYQTREGKSSIPDKPTVAGARAQGQGTKCCMSRYQLETEKVITLGGMFKLLNMRWSIRRKEARKEPGSM